MIYSNIFPFHSDVWGTVSDWAAVIVYGITGYLIYRTLKSQLKVQELQQKNTQIEIYNHIRNIQPVFTLEASGVTSRVKDDTLYIEGLLCQFKLNNNVAKNVSYDLDISAEIKNLANPGRNNFDFINLLEGFNLNFKFETNDIQSFLGTTMYYIDIDFYLNYEDIEKNRYRQKCSITITQNKNYIKSEHPIPIYA